MSSILKALKKLEDEQAGRATSSAGPGGQYVMPARSARPLLLLAGGVGVGLLLAGGMYLLLGDRSVSPVVTSSIPVSGQTPVLPVAQPPVQPSAKRFPAAAKPKTPLTVATAAVKAPSTAVPVKPRLPVPAVPGEMPAQRKTVASSPETVEQVAIERREIPAPGQQWTAAHLVVSEILPSAGGERMAIVNGLPVMEGTMVDEAVVSEIRADRVVFTQDGKSSTVPLTKAP